MVANHNFHSSADASLIDFTGFFSLADMGHFGLQKVSNSLMGPFGKGVIADNLPQTPANFPQTLRRISAPFPDAIKVFFFLGGGANFCQFSAEFPQTFHKNPFANDPISELLRKFSLLLGIGKWGDTTYRAIFLRGGKHTLECGLQNQLWRPQKVGFVWSVPASKENGRRAQTGLGKRIIGGGSKTVIGKGFMVCLPLP